MYKIDYWKSTLEQTYNLLHIFGNKDLSLTINGGILWVCHKFRVRINNAGESKVWVLS